MIDRLFIYGRPSSPGTTAELTVFRLEGVRPTTDAGPLLAWLERNAPAVLDDLRTLLAAQAGDPLEARST